MCDQGAEGILLPTGPAWGVLPSLAHVGQLRLRAQRGLRPETRLPSAGAAEAEADEDENLLSQLVRLPR